MERVAVLLTCHNRRDKTVACLRALRAQASPILDFQFSMLDGNVIQNQASNIQHQKKSIFIEVFLTDDGSSDGTAEAVRKVWPEATVIQGSGSLYWAGGMRVAWHEAEKARPDYFLLLNDDTFLEAHTLATLLSTTKSLRGPAIAVACIADTNTGEAIYGGRISRSADLMGKVAVPTPCDTFNANCVLVPRIIFKAIGMFSDVYTHGLADFDYGFLAIRRGFPCIQAPGILGYCEKAGNGHVWTNATLSRQERLRLLWFSPKGLPPRQWWHYTRRNWGAIWPYRFLSPAIRILLGK
jgi:GT2 family glycosyltransferase